MGLLNKESLADLARQRDDFSDAADELCEMDLPFESSANSAQAINAQKRIDRQIDGVFGWRNTLRRFTHQHRPQV